jgi:hypothetical protein
VAKAIVAAFTNQERGPMSDIRSDRDWQEAIDRYVKRAGPRRARRRAGGQGRYVLGSALVLSLIVSPFAIGTTGDLLREGKRNPSQGSAKRETEIIAATKTYGTRQSNIKNGNGGGAVYGCRSNPSREPCIRSNNLRTGRAFEFETDGAEGGRIEANAPGARPLTTNATGVATGLNADRVDGLDGGRVDFRAAAGTASTEVLNLGGLILKATCNAGPDIDVRADTTVINSTIHVSWNRDPANQPFYRDDNDFDPGDNFAIMSAGNDDRAQGTLVYSSPGGSHVSVTFQSEEANAFANTTACLFAGTALGSAG